MNIEISPGSKLLLERAKRFISEQVLPVESEYFKEVAKGDRWQHTPRMVEILDGLKNAAREQGLWNFFLPEKGPGMCAVDYAYIAEATGHSLLAAEAFNCSAPDTGNMEVLLRYGSEQQKEEWLQPLLAGEIRSAFAMTEPGVASSDATNIAMTAVEENGHWVINGEKFYISGAGDPRCKILICMVLTDPDSGKHTRHSQILVPMDTPGVEIVRPMHVFSLDDAPHGHMHLRFTNVKVPFENVISGRGRGFEISQGRLGPGRIHHCMRAIGAAEKALALMCERALARKAFGKRLAELGANHDIIADCRTQIDMARLLTLQTAYVIDHHGVKAARVLISQIKVVAPNTALMVIDEAIQLHGASGVSQDFPLAHMYMQMRTLRLADGPDAVHRRVVARQELGKYIQA
ncbi:MAG: acyl-CoA dehydrogenase [Gammaproteobacteria bacterium]|nr:acyl-CoA dehydrogenase [Gammaproteobacteria bacterium]